MNQTSIPPEIVFGGGRVGRVKTCHLSFCHFCPCFIVICVQFEAYRCDDANGRLILIHLQCWEVPPYLTLQRQAVSQNQGPKGTGFSYTAGAELSNRAAPASTGGVETSASQPIVVLFTGKQPPQQKMVPLATKLFPNQFNKQYCACNG